MDEAEMAEIREAALRQGMTVSEWARAALRAARKPDAGGAVDRKLAAIRAADRCSYPTGDMDTMLSEINAGYGEASES